MNERSEASACGEEGAVVGPKVTVQGALEDNMPCVVHSAWVARGGAVWAEALVTGRAVCTTQPVCGLGYPVHTCAQFCHGNMAAAFTNLSPVSRHAVLIWV